MGTDKIIYFSVFLPKQLNFSSNSGGSFFFLQIDNYSQIHYKKL